MTAPKTKTRLQTVNFTKQVMQTQQKGKLFQQHLQKTTSNYVHNENSNANTNIMTNTSNKRQNIANTPKTDIILYLYHENEVVNKQKMQIA